MHSVEPCGEACKQRRLQLDADCKQLRRELAAAEESRKTVEEQSRTFEQEVRREFVKKVLILQLILNRLYVLCYTSCASSRPSYERVSRANVSIS